MQAQVGGDADHRDGAARVALQGFGDRKGFDGRHNAHRFDGLAAAAKELLLTGVGTALDANCFAEAKGYGIEVSHHAADLAAGSGEGVDGHGTGARDPTVQPRVRIALAKASRLGRLPGPLAAPLPSAPARRHHLHADRRQGDQRQLDVLDPKGDANDRDGAHHTRQPPAQAHHQAAEYKPEDVEQQGHGIRLPVIGQSCSHGPRASAAQCRLRLWGAG